MNKSDLKRNNYRLKGPLAKKGYDWWWHSFTGKHHKTGEEKSFYIEYFVINPEISPDKIVFGQNSDKAIPSYVMMNAGVWGKQKKQLHQFYPTQQLAYDKNYLKIRVNDCTLTETHIVGSIEAKEEQSNNKEYMTDSGKMTWDLKVDKQIAYNVGYGAGRVMRLLHAFEMYWHAEGIKTLYEGHVLLDGERYIVDKETSFGYADKNWGKDFTSPWLWISSCHLVSKMTNRQLHNSAIELGGGRPKIFGLPIKEKILIGIYYEGEMIEFNFSKFWKKSRVKFIFEETETKAVWKVKASNKEHKIKLTLECNLEDMLEINYEAPNGSKQHNHLLNGGTGRGYMKIYSKDNTLIDDIAIFNAGCEYGEFDQ